MINRYSSRQNQRKARIRAKIRGTQSRPRVSVFRSNKAILIQVIDDTQGKTLAAQRGKSTLVSVAEIGKKLSEKCLKLNIKTVVFDRGPYQYHGKIKALAESLRQQGLEF